MSAKKKTGTAKTRTAKTKRATTKAKGKPSQRALGRLAGRKTVEISETNVGPLVKTRITKREGDTTIIEDYVVDSRKKGPDHVPGDEDMVSLEMRAPIGSLLKGKKRKK